MELQVLVLFILLIHMDYGEQPLSSCGDFTRPYKTMNNSCSNFKEVCVKNGDKECDNFQNVCQQCPSSNFSVLMYLDMINMKDQIVSMKTNDMTKIGNNLIILYILVGLILLLLLLMFLEIRFKLFTNCCGNRQNKYIPVRKNSVPREDVQLDPLNQENGQYSQINQENGQYSQINSILQSFDEKFIKIEESLKKSLKLRNNMKFTISGASRPIELFIRPNENVLQVKRQICSNCPAAKPNDYKIMIIKFKCQPLNDHNNFMAYNIPTNTTLDCEFDNNLNPDDFVILKLQGNTDLPELLKISKERRISDLKAFIECHNNINSNLIIREMKTGQELRNEMILKNCRLQDDDWIDIIREMNRQLTAISIFNESELCYVTFSNIDMILTIKNQIRSQLKLKSENIILFWNNLHLEDEKYVQDYNINEEFPIKFCYLKMLDQMKILSGNMIRNDFYTLTKGQHLNTSILLQRYKLKENTSIIKSSSFKNQLINYLIINSHPRFMSIHGIYLDKTDLFVLMESKSEEIIVEKIKDEKDGKISENEIAKWSRQILDGLQYLHDNNIVHRNLKPTSIFVDLDGNIKLSCFNMIGSSNHDEYIMENSELVINYWSPEVIKSQQFSIKSDVWSFGAVLFYIVTKKPFPQLNEKYTYSKSEYSNLGVSNEFQDFINQCLTEDQNERPDVDTLLKHSFLRLP